MARSIGVIRPDQELRGGNRVTSSRWAAILAELGFDVREETSWSGFPFDVLVALHAGRSHDSVRRFLAAHPRRPCIVGAAGTDVYGEDPVSEEALASFRSATRIVVLQPRAIDRLPAELRERVRVIHQSATTPARLPAKVADAFQACSVAHLRP